MVDQKTMTNKVLDFVSEYYDGYDEAKKVMNKIVTLPLNKIKEMYKYVCNYVKLEDKIDEISEECEAESDSYSESEEED